ncbi:flagellar biosynthesis, cell-distal portion of basal-body rod [Klebsiella pneumoniae]|nr:flagellar biosynthesis, cell-distal portion of basal-body rod [Klebsiella pneumoniae]
MAEVPLPTPTDNPVPSTDIRDAVYAGAMLDKVVTSTDLTYTDRLGGEHYTVDGMKAEGDKVVEETRQNLIPLSRQYMTLAAAQADIANIPEGSTTYYRSPDDSALAIEVMNVGGTLQPTGRKMPSAMPMGYQSATAVSSGAANTIAITIPGLLVDGSLIYFLSPILNTAAVSVTVTDARGNSVTRAIQKQNNAALVGNELLLNQPALMEFRTGTANNFVLVASGPVAAELASRISTLELNSVALLSGVANTGDAYSGTASAIPGIVASDRVFLFTPSATNTTRTPTLSVNGGTARQIKQNNGTNVAAGDLVAGYTYLVKFNYASADFRLLTYPADRSRVLNGYSKATVTSDATSPNSVALTIPGLLGDGTQLTFEPVAANTGAMTLVITDMYGNTVTRNLFKGANTALTGGELRAAMPATVQYRGSPQNNFKLLYAGDPTSDILNLKSDVTTLQGAITDPYAALANKLVGSTASTDQSPHGSITWNAGNRTITKTRIICTSIGSSVGVGAGSTGGGVAGATYAPNTLFVNALKAELLQYGEFDIIDDNQCIPTQAFQQFAAQLANSPYSTSDFVLIVGGMNDAPVGNYNMGRTKPGQESTLRDLIDLCMARGAIPIVCTTPHHNVEMPQTYPTIPGGNPLSWPYRTYNVGPSTYAFDSSSKTITQGAFANPLYGGDILKPGYTLHVASGVNAGDYTIASISSDRTEITVVESIPSTTSYSTTITHTNLNSIIEDILIPPPSLSFVTKDWTGNGVSVKGDIRFSIINNMMRKVARQKSAFLADCEYSFFKYGVEMGGYSSVYNVAAGNYNHMNDNGYTVTFDYTLKVAARKIAALIFGEKYYSAS